jgi:DNA polymerase-1|tara:strand:+ start:1357 stop:2331 length:975 start_codon:yes stop_codon:yes gene_type:complete
MSSSKRVLIVDQLNLFFRNYIVNPSISTDGAPIGGLRGCIQSLQKVIRESKPDMVVICWDGAGGSKKRKLIKKDYKAGRKPIRLNRAIRNMSDDEETDNKFWQQSRLVDYYNQIPVIQFMFDATEADDIIAYVSKHKLLEDYDKIILSSDKDFFQLLDDKTVLYRPVQKEILNKNNIVDKFSIHPTNFAMARAMAGDKSDNIEGIPGVGLKTISRRFPFLKEGKTKTFSDIITHCKKELEGGEIKAYRNILESEEMLKRNYQMMQLYAPLLSIDEKNLVNATLQDPDQTFNKTELIKMMIKDGFGEINFVDLFRHFNKIALDNR